MVSAFGFLTGDWVADIHGGQFEESWSSPEGDSLVGHGRLIVDGKTKFMEFLSIEESGEGALTMFIVLGSLSKGEKVPVAFSLESQADGQSKFVRGGSDFPVSIEYQRLGGRLLCTLLGEDGKTEIYDFRKLAR